MYRFTGLPSPSSTGKESRHGGRLSLSVRYCLTP
jgi:hypothetical protein